MEVVILLEAHALVPNQVGALKLKKGLVMLQLQIWSPCNLHAKALQVVHISRELANVSPVCGCEIFTSAAKGWRSIGSADPHLLTIKRHGVTLQLFVVAGLLCQVVVRQLDIGLPIQGQLRQQAIDAIPRLLRALILGGGGCDTTNIRQGKLKFGLKRRLGQGWVKAHADNDADHLCNKRNNLQTHVSFL